MSLHTRSSLGGYELGCRETSRIVTPFSVIYTVYMHRRLGALAASEARPLHHRIHSSLHHKRSFIHSCACITGEMRYVLPFRRTLNIECPGLKFCELQRLEVSRFTAGNPIGSVRAFPWIEPSIKWKRAQTKQKTCSVEGRRSWNLSLTLHFLFSFSISARSVAYHACCVGQIKHYVIERKHRSGARRFYH